MTSGPGRVSPTLVLLGAAGLAAACAAPQPWWQKDLQDWQGAPVTELLEAWGPPLRVVTGENETTVLLYETVRELDYRLEALADPGARLDPDRERFSQAPGGRSECVVFFEIAAEQVKAVRHEGATCEIVPRDPARRRVDPAPGGRR
jgi:hypothetical protein